MPHGGFFGFSYSWSMNAVHKHRSLTLGEFIVGVYDACGEQRARVIVWLAMRARLVRGRATIPGNSPECPWAETGVASVIAK
jgi:hypothetical protein